MSLIGEVSKETLQPVIDKLDVLPWKEGWDAGLKVYSMLVEKIPSEFPVAVLRTWAQSKFPKCSIPLTIIANLTPEQRIRGHKDFEYDSTHRVHIPLQTNPGALIWEDGIPIHMEVGKAYSINPQINHSIYNGGFTDRIHVIFVLV